MEIKRRPSDHFEERRNGARPSFIILHYTETKDAQTAEDYFLGRTKHPTGGRVSAHYMIEEEGKIIQYVDEDKRAWHAGVSYWNGIEDINSHSIGIELVNPGHKYGYRRFTSLQMEALVALCQNIKARRAISPFKVLAHSDVAPSRKIDPGELFDWSLLAQKEIAIWPDPQKEDFDLATDYVADMEALKEAFVRIGYDHKAGLTDLITAFQRHFYQEAFQSPTTIGEPTRDMAARLCWLERMRPDL